MRNRLIVFILLLVSAVVGVFFLRSLQQGKRLPRPAVQQHLRVLTYSTFVGPSGPGRDIIAKFENDTGCKVDVTTAGDAGLLLERLKIAEATTGFDVVLGLDQPLVEEARQRFSWRSAGMGRELFRAEISPYLIPDFVPFDWSALTFVYRQSDFQPPQKFEDLLDPKWKEQFALQDPRSSSPGLQFLGWVRSIKGGQTVQFLQNFKPNVQSVSPSWAFSYGLFKKERARFVFSYLTSLAFHWGVENQTKFQVLNLEEGHPIQVEYAGVPGSCHECELAIRFVKVLVEPWAQKIIMEKNFMFPVIGGIEKDTVFDTLPKLKIRPTSTDKDFRDWDKAFKN